MADSGTDWGSAGAFLGAGAMSALGAYFANRQQQQLLKKQWSQGIELANTAHQREVADLLKAGLNPILSANGTGASVPSLGTGSFDNVGQGLSDGLTSASKVISDEYKANVDSVKANTEQVKEVNSALKADRVVANTNREYEKLLADAKKSSLEDMMGFRTVHDKDGFSMRYMEDPKKYERFKLALKAGIVGDAFNSAGSLISKFNPLK